MEVTVVRRRIAGLLHRLCEDDILGIPLCHVGEHTIHPVVRAGHERRPARRAHRGRQDQVAKQYPVTGEEISCKVLGYAQR